MIVLQIILSHRQKKSFSLWIFRGAGFASFNMELQTGVDL